MASTRLLLSNRVLLPLLERGGTCRERQTHGNGRSVVNVALNAERTAVHLD